MSGLLAKLYPDVGGFVKTDLPRRKSHLFTLRIWREDLADGHIEIRGQVSHVPTGKSYFFRNWQALENSLENILNQLESEGPDQSPPPFQSQNE